MYVAACIHTLSAHAYLRVELDPNWYILVRKLALPFLLLTFFWSGAEDHLRETLTQLLN